MARGCKWAGQFRVTIGVSIANASRGARCPGASGKYLGGAALVGQEVALGTLNSSLSTGKSVIMTQLELGRRLRLPAQLTL